jgi:hypothetical protein
VITARSTGRGGSTKNPPASHHRHPPRVTLSHEGSSAAATAGPAVDASISVVSCVALLLLSQDPNVAVAASEGEAIRWAGKPTQDRHARSRGLAMTTRP